MSESTFNPAAKPIRVVPPVPGQRPVAPVPERETPSAEGQPAETKSAKPAEAPVTSVNIANLLRSPGGCVRYLVESASCGKLVALLLLLTVCGAALWGFSVGFFIDWKVALLDAAKFAGVSLFAYVLCLPTLYVFACLSGARLSFPRIAALGLMCTAMMGCVCAALAPIVWLFAVSTGSIVFFAWLVLLLAAVAAFFAFSPIDGAIKVNAVRHSTGLTVWFCILLVVALQALTFVRPILAPVGTKSEIAGKCFFVEHFFRALMDLPKESKK